MFENLKLRWFLVISSIVFGVYFTFPSYETFTSDNSNAHQSRENVIGLGLDLKGGLRVVLELDEKKFLSKISNIQAKKFPKKEFNQLLNEAEKKSINNSSSLINEFLKNASANNLMLKTFFKFKLDDNEDIAYAIREKKLDAMIDIIDIMRDRIESHDQYGLGEPSIQQVGDNRLMVELAGVTDATRAKKYIQKTADFELTLIEKPEKFIVVLNTINEFIKENNFDFPNIDSLIFSYYGKNNYCDFCIEESKIDILNRILSLNEIKTLINEKYKILWHNQPFNHLPYDNHNMVYFLSSDPEPLNFSSNQNLMITPFYLVSSKPEITGGMIVNPKAAANQDLSLGSSKWIVNLEMNNEGRKKWGKTTGRYKDRQIAIILDSKVYMTPTIRDKITSGNTQISGFSNMQEAKDIAQVLKAGELPAPINIIHEKYIGPSLGKDSINQGAKSMMIGLILVLVFMLIYYKGSGLVANIALLINLLIVFGVLVSMNAILTLPGIAGLLLTIGMTVDANVIIFERIREEIKLENKPIIAIKNGYNRAFETILDANITTLLTAFVLSFIGSGPIKGFATTLSVGIICSMFTAIFVSRTIFMTFINFRNVKKLSI